MLHGDRGSGTATAMKARGQGVRKGNEEGGAHLGSCLQAALDNLEFLFAGGKFLLQVL